MDKKRFTFTSVRTFILHDFTYPHACSEAIIQNTVTKRDEEVWQKLNMSPDSSIGDRKVTLLYGQESKHVTRFIVFFFFSRHEIRCIIR